MLNNRSLMYTEGDIQMSVLTPNTFLYGQPIMIPEESLGKVTSKTKRCQRYISKCKEAAWKRWEKEYSRSLQERCKRMHNTKEMKIEVWVVVLIKDEEKNKGKWNITIVEELFRGKDDFKCGLKLQTPKSLIERSIRYLHSLELRFDMGKPPSKFKSRSKKKLNVDAKEYRPRRSAATTAEMWTSDIVAEQSDEGMNLGEVFNIEHEIGGECRNRWMKKNFTRRES